ncbi:MAG: acyl-CoA thioesterase [Myxococcales bacterium]|nr:acyl-CoA thioesterase [Myxococcales bacterium]
MNDETHNSKRTASTDVRIVHPSATRTEMTWIVMPGDCNALDTVFGGQVCSWIDVCAAVAAQRFCNCNVVTAGMDGLVFKAPIRRGMVAVLQAQVNWAGRTSMEVGVRVEEEDPFTGKRVHTSAAYLTFVAVDTDRKPCPVPQLRPHSEIEIRRHREAQQRRQTRLAHRERIRAGRNTP